MSSAVVSKVGVVVDDGVMATPRAGGPSRRRSFTAAQKLQHLAEYEAACETGQGGAYLRREGLYSSLISEWRRLRDAGAADDLCRCRKARAGCGSTEPFSASSLARTCSAGAPSPDLIIDIAAS